jgi:hypothetical protein
MVDFTIMGGFDIKLSMASFFRELESFFGEGCFETSAMLASPSLLGTSADSSRAWFVYTIPNFQPRHYAHNAGM